MSSRPRFALIGAGMWAPTLVGAVRADGRADLVAVASRSLASARALAEKHGIARATDDWKSVVTDSGVDAVIVASPPATHAAVAIASLQAGKHVLLEKPAVATAVELRRLLAVAERRPRLVVAEASGRFTRYEPKFAYVRDLIASGRIGRVYHIHHVSLNSRTFLEYNVKGKWSTSRAEGGGPVLDWGPYDLAFHLGLLEDKPKLQAVRSVAVGGLRVLAQAPEADVEQHCAAWMQFSGGLTYYYERGSGTHGDVENETRIHGTRATLRFNYHPWAPPQVEFTHSGKEGREAPGRDEMPVPGKASENWNVPLVANFVDAIQRKAKPTVPLKLAAKHLDILFRLRDGR